MIDHAQLHQQATAARLEWEMRAVDWDKLQELYRKWVEEFGNVGHQIALSLVGLPRMIANAQSTFPKGCCGMASCLLASRIPNAQLVHGLYECPQQEPHTWVMVDDLVLDITADQFGGPPVYIGPLEKPWIFPK